MPDPAITPGSWASAHVVVTGAANGIGQSIVRSFAKLGATVTGVDVDALGLGELQEAGVLQHLIHRDLSGSDAGDVIDKAWQLAPVDVLVNGAGLYPAVHLSEVTPVLWDRIMNINARAPMLTTTALGRLTRTSKRHASVVNISSGAAKRSRPGGGLYAISKAALNMVTRAAALEFGEIGMRVNAVSPGFVDVGSTANPVTPEYRAAMSATPAGRAGQPEDIARAVLWLADPSSDWVTGTILGIDGGSSAGVMDLPLHWDGLSLAQSASPEHTNHQNGALQ